MSKNQNSIRVRQFYQNAQDLFLPCDPVLFNPDEWTESEASGVQELDLDDKLVMEVGVGGGVNMVGVMTSPNAPRHFIGTDIDERAVQASNNIAQLLGISNVTLGQSDLLNSFNSVQRLNPLNPLRNVKLEDVDTIFACIPQIPRQNVDLTQKDNYSHYYKADGSHWDMYSLGLNAKLLHQAPKGTGVAENLSGRSGKDVLASMFSEAKRPFDIVHERVIPQHLGTSLHSLARMEDEGHVDFEFFEDDDANTPMNARQAESARLAAIDAGHDTAAVHHKIYVMHAPGVR